MGIGAKTSLIERLINNKFLEKPWCTVGHETRIKKVLLKNGKPINLMFYDICGQESQFRLLPIKYIKNSFCIIFGFCNEETFFWIKDFWYPYVKDCLNGQLIYLIMNKIDLVQDREVEGKNQENLKCLVKQEKELRIFWWFNYSNYKDIYWKIIYIILKIKL